MRDYIATENLKPTYEHLNLYVIFFMIKMNLKIAFENPVAILDYIVIATPMKYIQLSHL